MVDEALYERRFAQMLAKGVDTDRILRMIKGVKHRDEIALRDGYRLVLDPSIANRRSGWCMIIAKTL